MMTMMSDSILIRKQDNKKFKVTFLAHWSDIESEDGEKDTVKWLGSNEYVSHSKGFGYILQEQNAKDN